MQDNWAQEWLELEILGMQALVAASRGDVDAARAFGQRSLRLQELTGSLGAHIHGLALLELSLENYEAAYELVLLRSYGWPNARLGFRR